MPLDSGDQEAIFRLTLKKGTMRLTARFLTDDDRILGAYYAQVEKL